MVISIDYSYAQTDSTKVENEKLYVITKNDGTQYIGKIISDDGRELLIVTEKLGKIYIPKSEVKEIKEVLNSEDIKNGEFQEIGPFSTRYYFTTNAFGIKKGEDYAMIHLYGPEVHFALTDKFSLGIMSTWIASPIALAAKYSFENEKNKVHFSLGSIVGSSGYLSNFRGFGGLHWASVTYGQRKQNITFSAGYGYFNTGVKSTNYDPIIGSPISSSPTTIKAPIVSIAGIAKVSKSASFIFDSMIAFDQHSETNYPYVADSQDSLGNWIPGYTDYSQPQTAKGNRVSMFLMPGMRFQTRENKAFQVALAGVIQWDEIGTVTFSTQGGIPTYSKKVRSFPVPMCSWFFKF
jgi:hypothetical protein